jgi:integrase
MIAIRSQKLKNGLFSLYLDIYYNGKRNYEFLNLQVSKDYSKDSKRLKSEDKEKWELANSIKAKRELEIKNDEHGFVANFKKAGNFIDYFQSKLAVKNHRSYNAALGKLKEFAGEKLLFKSIDEQWVNRFRAYLLENCAEHNTAFANFVRVKTILNMAVKEKIIIRNPFQYADSLSQRPGKKPHLEFEQLQKLYNTSYGETLFEKHAVKGFLFSCFAGLRLSDASAFKWTDLYNGKISYTQEKTNKTEHLPLPDQALKILETMEHSPDTDRVFFSLDPKLSYQIGLVLNAWAKEAKVDKYITFHVARHTFATLLITYDVDLYTVSKLLGHSDMRMTQLYAKVVDKKKIEAVSKLPSFSEKPVRIITSEPDNADKMDT